MLDALGRDNTVYLEHPSRQRRAASYVNRWYQQPSWLLSDALVAPGRWPPPPTYSAAYVGSERFTGCGVVVYCWVRLFQPHPPARARGFGGAAWSDPANAAMPFALMGLHCASAWLPSTHLPTGRAPDSLARVAPAVARADGRTAPAQPTGPVVAPFESQQPHHSRITRWPAAVPVAAPEWLRDACRDPPEWLADAIRGVVRFLRSWPPFLSIVLWTSYVAYPHAIRLIKPWRIADRHMATTDVWGVFCPVFGILFATLTSATVERLWYRRERIGGMLTAEANELESLTHLLDEADQADQQSAKFAKGLADAASVTKPGEGGAPTREIWRPQLSSGRGPHVAFQCIARHPVLRKQAWRSHDGRSLGRSYTEEISSISGGEGSDPLADLLALFPPQLGSSQVEACEEAWAAAAPQARASVLRLMELRGKRLAAQESRPPANHCTQHGPNPGPAASGAKTAAQACDARAGTFLGLSAASLVFGFTLVAVDARPAHHAASRVLFSALTSALLVVFRLLSDLSEPFSTTSSSTSWLKVSTDLMSSPWGLTQRCQERPLSHMHNQPPGTRSPPTASPTPSSFRRAAGSSRLSRAMTRARSGSSAGAGVGGSGSGEREREPAGKKEVSLGVAPSPRRPMGTMR